MNHTAYTAFRSASLPSTTQQLHVSPLNLQAKRDSGYMVIDGPITPPLSPGRSEDGDLHPPVECDPQAALQCSEAQVNPADPQIACSLPGSRRVSREAQQPAEHMQVDSGRSTLASIPPIRHLEDEKSHVHRGDYLKLTDFEVKGTLGEFVPSAYTRILN